MDVNYFKSWAEHLTSTHTMPTGDTWQYPPLAAFLLLLPRLFGGNYFYAFVGIMLAVDLAGLAVLAARRNGLTTRAVWWWLLVLPLLAPFSVLQFDLVPTVALIAACPRCPSALLVRRRGGCRLHGQGGRSLPSSPSGTRRFLIASPAWPWSFLSFGAAAWFFGDQSGFFEESSPAVAQVDAVEATPWRVRG
jgi:hypothetical protein